MKICPVCKNYLSIKKFYIHKITKDGHSWACKKCTKAKQKEYRKKNPDKAKKWYLRNRKNILNNKKQNNLRKRQWNKKIRLLVLNHYGAKCKCCGEAHLEFLTIDHIHGNGNQHRKIIPSTIYVWLKQNNYPKGFRILCFNCNCAKYYSGYCPHKRRKRV